MRHVCENGIYDGEVNYKNEPHGKGEFTWNNKDKYVGEFKNGNYVGKGKIYYHDGKILEGVFNGLYNVTNASLSKGDKKIVGKIVNGEFIELHRYGKITFDNGYYDGEIKDDLPNGEGVYYLNDGTVISGTFVDGLMEGEITVKSKDANFKGNHKKGLRSGYGVLETNDYKYEGEWLNNKKEGFGKEIYKNGGYYEGEWEENDWSGNGKRVNADGSFFEGYFIDRLNAIEVIYTLRDGKTKIYGEIITIRHSRL